MFFYRTKLSVNVAYLVGNPLETQLKRFMEKLKISTTGDPWLLRISLMQFSIMQNSNRYERKNQHKLSTYLC